MLSVRTDDTGQRARDANDIEHESERRRQQQQSTGKQSKHSALCVPSQVLLVLKMRLAFSSR
jgi:hypothetical protein